GKLVAGSLASALAHGVPHSLLDAAEIRRRFPVFKARDDECGLFEEQAGVLLPERCIESQLTLAAAAGAELRHGAPVLAWAVEAGEVQVEMAGQRLRAGSLVVTAGAWAGRLLSELALPLQAERIPTFWFRPRHVTREFELGHLPIWIWQHTTGDFFGTPHV